MVIIQLLSAQTAEQYQESAAMQFCGGLQEKTLRAAFYSTGVAEELSELLDAVLKNDKQNIIAEAGDVMWYFSQFLKENGIEMSKIIGEKNSDNDAGDAVDIESADAAADVTEKKHKIEVTNVDFSIVHLAFGKVFGKQKRLILGKVIAQEDLVKICSKAFSTLEAFMENNYEVGMREVLVYNNKKLVDRIKREVIIGDGDYR